MAFLKDHSPPKMKSGEELKKIIDKAIYKVHGTKENDLCKFLPGRGGGYMHHFTLKKLKNSSPDELSSLIQEFIINATQPKSLDPKPRAPRGSRKRKDIISITRTDIEKVLDLARKMGDKELLAKFSPKRSLTSLKRELIRSIKQNQVCPELWNGYIESVSLAKNAHEIESR